MHSFVEYHEALQNHPAITRHPATSPELPRPQGKFSQIRCLWTTEDTPHRRGIQSSRVIIHLWVSGLDQLDLCKERIKGDKTQFYSDFTDSNVLTTGTLSWHNVDLAFLHHELPFKSVEEILIPPHHLHRRWCDFRRIPDVGFEYRKIFPYSAVVTPIALLDRLQGAGAEHDALVHC